MKTLISIPPFLIAVILALVSKARPLVQLRTGAIPITRLQKGAIPLQDSEPAQAIQALVGGRSLAIAMAVSIPE
jgi:hypothetical protein